MIEIARSANWRDNKEILRFCIKTKVTNSQTRWNSWKMINMSCFLMLQKRDLKICTLKKQKSSQVTYVSILSPIILSSHWLFSKHFHSCLPRDSTLVGQASPRLWLSFYTITMARHLSALFSTPNPILSVTNLSRLDCAKTQCASVRENPCIRVDERNFFSKTTQSIDSAPGV